MAIKEFNSASSSPKLFSSLDRRTVANRLSPRMRRRALAALCEALECRQLFSLTAIDGGLLVSDPDFVDVNGVKGATWLANADLAKTKTFQVAGINADGSMTWETALTWVAAMNAADYLGHSNWTLPLTPDKDPNGTIFNDTYDAKFGFDCDAGGMGHLFYDEFGGVAGESISEIHNSSTALFKNFQPYLYWGGYWPLSDRPLPVSFTFSNGFLGTTNDNDFLFAIPEFPSDPTDLPQPATANNIISVAALATSSSLTASPSKLIVHDSTLNVNWLANADLAATNSFGLPVGSNTGSTAININPDGSMNIPTANAWIAAMNATDYLGHNNWRLPDTSDDPDLNHAGYDHNGSEMGELYYTELGGIAGSTISLTHDSDFSLFHNMQPDLYWSGTSNLDQSGNNGNKTFSFGNGYQGGNYEADQWFVIPVFDGNMITVTNNHDSGAGSLRAAVAAANPGDTINFASSLSGTTINLQSTITIDEQLYIVGPIAGGLAISGQNKIQLFDVASAGAATIIAHLTLEKGLANEGGAILDDGASLLLDSDALKQNQALGTNATASALGGALAVLGGASSGMTFTITTCLFTGDSALGASGGDGQGGTIYVDAGSSQAMTFLTDNDTTFSGDSATGGSGGAGDGGAIFYDDDVALSPVFSIARSSFVSDKAAGGNGAAGGAGAGGALFVEFANSIDSDVTLRDDDLANNTAHGGNGSAGANAASISGDAGNGGTGGNATGGAIDVEVEGAAVATNVSLIEMEIHGNSATGGNGGNAGRGLTGGNGGDGGSAWGGAILLDSNGNALTDTWTLQSATLLSNVAQSGAGGNGGGGPRAGNGGNAPTSLGGGIADIFDGTLDIVQSSVSKSTVEDGRAGKAGGGIQAGAKGASGSGFGGGLYLDANATANATPVLVTIKNYADFGPEVWGNLGT